MHWLKQTLDAEWYWYRYEYQARDAHGCAKLKNDPGVCDLVAKAALGWLEEKCAEEAIANNVEAAPNQHIINYGNEAKREAIRYVDWLVTTMNEAKPGACQIHTHAHKI